MPVKELRSSRQGTLFFSRPIPRLGRPVRAERALAPGLPAQHHIGFVCPIAPGFVGVSSCVRPAETFEKLEQLRALENGITSS